MKVSLNKIDCGTSYNFAEQNYLIVDSKESELTTQVDQLTFIQQSFSESVILSEAKTPGFTTTWCPGKSSIATAFSSHFSVKIKSDEPGVKEILSDLAFKHPASTLVLEFGVEFENNQKRLSSLTFEGIKIFIAEQNSEVAQFEGRGEYTCDKAAAFTAFLKIINDFFKSFLVLDEVDALSAVLKFINIKEFRKTTSEKDLMILLKGISKIISASMSLGIDILPGTGTDPDLKIAFNPENIPAGKSIPTPKKADGYNVLAPLLMSCKAGDKFNCPVSLLIIKHPEITLPQEQWINFFNDLQNARIPVIATTLNSAIVKIFFKAKGKIFK